VRSPQPLPGLRLLPILHDRVEMGAVVRRVLAELDPAAVAVELPETLAGAIDRAVRRLPKISVVISEEEGEDALVWVVAPGDPQAEALRWAIERDRPRFFIDPDIPYQERHRDPVPDPYALLDLGADRFLDLLVERLAQEPAEQADRQREAGMAHHLQQAREALDGSDADGPLLALVGAAHAERLARRLQSPTAIPFARSLRTRVTLRHLHPESLTGLLPDAPLAHAVHELLRRSELPPEPPLTATRARRLSLMRAGLTLITREEETWGGARRHRVAEYAAHRAAREGTPDRWALARVVWSVGALSYGEQTRESVGPWQRRVFFDFAYRYARTQGLLVPGLFEWVVAARGVADDNLAWEVFEAARSYPWQETQAEIETAHLDGDELDLGTRKVRFRRRFFRVKERPRLVPVRQHPAPETPEEWLEGFDGSGLCSFPPEDVVVEDYGRYLRKKAVGILSAERTRTEPFVTSLLDGIDIKETLRHVEDPRVWVRELGRAPGRAGSVVMIFDRDLEGARYPHLMTWLGEHDDESDMAFYSTHPAEQVVGPGILRATYGGFLMTVPRGRLWEVWRDQDYREAREKAEVLLMAGVDYSLETLVVHVAAKPPAERMHRYAAARGKKIVHIPLGALSPVTLKKIRVLHILVGRDKRAVAGDYIW
jgi:hypothetical protein